MAITTNANGLARIVDAGLDLCLAIDKLPLRAASRQKLDVLTKKFFAAVRTAKKIKKTPKVTALRAN